MPNGRNDCIGASAFREHSKVTAHPFFSETCLALTGYRSKVNCELPVPIPEQADDSWLFGSVSLRTVVGKFRYQYCSSNPFRSGSQSEQNALSPNRSLTASRDAPRRPVKQRTSDPLRPELRR
jgi:hypothetical protein